MAEITASEKIIELHSKNMFMVSEVIKITDGLEAKLAAAETALSDCQLKLEAQTESVAEERAKRIRAEQDVQHMALSQENDAYIFGEQAKAWKQRAEQSEAKVKRLIKKLTYNTPTFRDGECDDKLLTIDENELVPLKSCMCDRLEQAEASCAALIQGYCSDCDCDPEICRGTDPDMKCAVRALDGTAASALLAELQRYRGALEKIYEIEAETNYDEDCSGMKFGTSTESPTEIQKIVRVALSASSSAQRVQAAGEQGAPPETRMIKITGHVEVNVSHEEFMDKLIAFVEQNGWTFGGVTDEVRE